jgi:2'-5' RNA ligase
VDRRSVAAPRTMSRLDPHRVSLWLVPEGRGAEHLAAAIDSLATRFHGPRFAPHLTLLGGLDADAHTFTRLPTLAARLAPMPIALDGIEATPDYYRCLFLRAQRTSNLFDAHHYARAIWPQSGPARELSPHVSLLYGHLSPEQRAEATEKAAELSLPAVITLSRLELWATTGEPTLWRRLTASALGKAG